jgi:hypothetical protein
MTTPRLTAILIISFCALSPHAAPSDITATNLLIGSWVNQGEYRTLSENRTWTFRANGTFSFSTVLRCGDAEVRFETLGKWRVKDGMLIQEVTSGAPQDMHALARMRQRLLRINEKQARFRTEWGEEPVFVRKPRLEI